MLSRDQILQIDDRRHETVHVPEWGGDVQVSTMSSTDRDVWENELFDMKDGKAKSTVAARKYMRASLVARCITGEDGKRVFENKDIPALAEKNARAVDRVFTVAQRINGITKEDQEELLGKSTGTTGEGSSSD